MKSKKIAKCIYCRGKGWDWLNEFDNEIVDCQNCLGSGIMEKKKEEIGEGDSN
jgi:DnaJ-class molecular chaperone